MIVTKIFKISSTKRNRIKAKFSNHKDKDIMQTNTKTYRRLLNFQIQNQMLLKEALQQLLLNIKNYALQHKIKVKNLLKTQKFITETNGLRQSRSDTIFSIILYLNAYFILSQIRDSFTLYQNSFLLISWMNRFQLIFFIICNKNQIECEDIIRMSEFSRYTTRRGQQLLKNHKLAESICVSNPPNQINYPPKQSLQPYNKLYFNQPNMPVNNPFSSNLAYDQPQKIQMNNFKLQNRNKQQQENISQSNLDNNQQQESCCSWFCCFLTTCGVIFLLILLAALAVGLLYYLGYLKFNIKLYPQNLGQSRFDFNFQIPENTKSQASSVKLNANMDQMANADQTSLGSENHPKTTFMTKSEDIKPPKTLFMYPQAAQSQITKPDDTKSSTTFMLPPQNLHRLYFIR